MSNYNSNIIPYNYYPLSFPFNINVNYNLIPNLNNYQFYSPLNNTNKFLLSQYNSNFLLKKKHEKDNINIDQPIQNSSLNKITKLENQKNQKENEIVINLKEDDEEESKKKDSIKNIENQKNTPKKKRTSHKRNNDEELLQDSFLNHIGKPYSNPIRFFREELPKKKNYNKKQNFKQKNRDQNSTTNYQNPIKGIKRVVPLKITKINFYGNDYKQTNSPNDFMKYNFDFVSKEQYKTEKLIINKEKQTVDLDKINYNKNENINEKLPQKLYDPNEIKDFKELNNYLKLIERSWPKHIYRYSEDIALNFLKENNYSLDKFVDYFKSDEFKLFLKLIKKQSIL